MASTGSVTAQQTAERLLRRAAPPWVSARQHCFDRSTLLDLARVGDITEEQMVRVIADHTTRFRSPAGERPLSEVNFLTVAEAATLLRVSKMSVYRLMHSGKLPAIRVGRSFRVPEQAVHDYVRELHNHHPQ